MLASKPAVLRRRRFLSAAAGLFSPGGGLFSPGAGLVSLGAGLGSFAAGFGSFAAGLDAGSFAAASFDAGLVLCSAAIGLAGAPPRGFCAGPSVTGLPLPPPLLPPLRAPSASAPTTA